MSTQTFDAHTDAHDTTPTDIQSRPAPRRAPVLAILVAVAVVDQATKWWAWRHISSTTINPGGDALAPTWLDTAYRDRLAGALLDAADALILVLVAVWLVRRCKQWSRLPLTGAALIVGGWSGNVADRLGLHWLTAPGSGRGAVDWVGGYNLADLSIAGGALMLLASVAHRWMPEDWTATVRRRRAMLAAVAAIVGLLVAGATVDGRLTATVPPVAPTASGAGQPQVAPTWRSDSTVWQVAPSTPVTTLTVSYGGLPLTVTALEGRDGNPRLGITSLIAGATMHWTCTATLADIGAGARWWSLDGGCTTAVGDHRAFLALGTAEPILIETAQDVPGSSPPVAADRLLAGSSWQTVSFTPSGQKNASTVIVYGTRSGAAALTSLLANPHNHRGLCVAGLVCTGRI